MRQLWRLLLYLAAGAVLYASSCSECSYFESDPSCGYVEQDFVNFYQSPELTLEPAFGVCGWSFDGVPRLQPRVDKCLSCSFTPAEKPTCSAGTVLVRSPQWRLAQQQNCTWQGCWFSDGICRNGTAGSTASCPDGAINVNCCPFDKYVRCCSLVPCRARSAPAGHCVVGEKDLQAGQRFEGRWFAVNTASDDCYSYSFKSARLCQPDRTFAPEVIYETCDTVAVVSRDTDGCAKLPGYTFYRGRLVDDAASWRMDDGTQWGRLANPAEAQRTAALDMPLMASRCSAASSCAAFQNTGNSTDLLYQLPASKLWRSVEAPDSEASRCFGIYEKTPPRTSCPRIAGYLFIPMHTLDTSFNGSFNAPAGDGPCADCSDSYALAVRCETFGNDGACAGFSNYHGLITSRGAGVLSNQPLWQFTSTPCVGTFLRAGKAFPHEVEQLDRILCGEYVYCTSQLRYHATGQSASGSASYFVDLVVDILTDFTLPRTLLDGSSSAGLQQLPSVRSLVIRCLNGSVMLGGVPFGLTAVMPFLQELQIAGCGLTGRLPSEVAQFRYLQILDLSRNRLTGDLPAAWSSMSLGYLNLSSNVLTGSLPTAWRGIIKPQPAAPPPPPARATPPPPPPAPAEAQERGARGKMLAVDLSGNQLQGPIDHDYVYDSCVNGDVRMQLHGAPQARLLAELGKGGTPTFLLQYNPSIATWAGHYEYAVADVARLGGGSRNMCGSYTYKITLGVLWGIFGMCLLAIILWSIWTCWRDSRAERRQQFLIADATAVMAAAPASALDGTNPAASNGATSADAAAQGAPAAADGRGAPAAKRLRAFVARLVATLTWLWGKRWVRRVVLLLRVCFLLADVALDIAVTVWLFNNEDDTSSAVCLAFIVATQAAVSAAVYASVAPHFFASRVLIAGLAPILVALGPVTWPVLAVGWLRSSDLPLVFWRYLELVEFCVALLQAPAEAVTQSVVYARQNRMGNGMYMNHGLFIASIILSMGDMLIAALKLCRYKRGPLRRILVAITHLDNVRDPVHYRLDKPLEVQSDGGAAYGLATNRGGASYGLRHPLTEPLNSQPLLLGGTGAGAGFGSGGGLEPSRSQVLRVGSSLPVPLEADVTGQEDVSSQAADAQAATEPGAVGAGAAAGTPHTFMPLAAPRYRPSLLVASAQRLSGSTLGLGLGMGGGSSHPLTPSRLGPGTAGSARHASITVPAQPPLRPLLGTLPASASLPVTPASAASRVDTDTSNPAAGAATPRGHDPSAEPSASATITTTTTPITPLAQGATREEEAADHQTQQQHPQRQGLGGRAHDDKARSLLQAASPASQPLGSQNPPSGVNSVAATGGHGPPPSSGQLVAAAAMAAAAAAAAAQDSDRSSYRSSAGGGVVSSSTVYGSARSSDASRPSAPRLSGNAPAWPPPPPPIFPPSAPAAAAAGSYSADGSRYLSSAAAAAAAALADAAGGSGAGPAGSSHQGPGPAAPAGLVLSPVSSFGPAGEAGVAAPLVLPGGPTGAPQPGAALLRRVPSIASAAHSANVSPARRREAPALSIAVPASPVQSQGIEVIRMSASSARHLSPQTSQGTVSWLTEPPAMPPPPPPPPQLQQPPPLPPRRAPNKAKADPPEG